MHDEKRIFMVESLIKQIIMIRSNVWHITRMVVSSISLCEYVFYLFCTAYFAFARYCKVLLSIIHIWMNSPKHTFTTTKIDCTKIAPAIPCILNSHWSLSMCTRSFLSQHIVEDWVHVCRDKNLIFHNSSSFRTYGFGTNGFNGPYRRNALSSIVSIIETKLFEMSFRCLQAKLFYRLPLSGISILYWTLNTYIRPTSKQQAKYIVYHQKWSSADNVYDSPSIVIVLSVCLCQCVVLNHLCAPNL